MPDDQPSREGGYLRICRNPSEPFYWDADSPDEPCPGQGCEDGQHDTYVPASTLQAAETERDEARLEMSTEKHLRFGAEAREDALQKGIEDLRLTAQDQRYSDEFVGNLARSLLSTQKPTPK